MFEAGIIAMFAMVGVGMLALASLVAWIWALVDILKNDFTGPNKLIWLILVLVIPLLGVILYYFIGRNQKLPPHSN